MINFDQQKAAVYSFWLVIKLIGFIIALIVLIWLMSLFRTFVDALQAVRSESLAVPVTEGPNLSQPEADSSAPVGGWEYLRQ